MTQSLQELLEQVRSAQAQPEQWAGLQTRVLSALANGNPVVTPGGNEAASVSAAARNTVTARASGPTAWLGGSIAVGAVVAGLMLASQAGSELAESERSAEHGHVLAPRPIVFDAVFRDLGAETWSPRVTSRKPHPTPPAIFEAPAASEAPVTSEAPDVASDLAGPTVVAFDVRELGESDVEYDRRHLAPIDAALQAHQPHQALRLVSGFTPRKLTNYARALEAIALCGVGQTAEGRRLSVQTLPQVTNRGLARRMQSACKPSSANEPK